MGNVRDSQRSKPSLKRVHVYVSGRVQGVYFRHHTLREAQRLGVKGWVRNLADGRVEAIFEGKKRDVDAVIEFCRAGPIGAQVDQVEIAEEPYSGQFTDFEIYH